MSTTVIYEKIQKLKLEMILDGWDIEEKYSNDGWKNHPGYPSRSGCICGRSERMQASFVL